MNIAIAEFDALQAIGSPHFLMERQFWLPGAPSRGDLQLCAALPAAGDRDRPGSAAGAAMLRVSSLCSALLRRSQVGAAGGWCSAWKVGNPCHRAADRPPPPRVTHSPLPLQADAAAAPAALLRTYATTQVRCCACLWVQAA